MAMLRQPFRKVAGHQSPEPVIRCTLVVQGTTLGRSTEIRIQQEAVLVSKSSCPHIPSDRGWSICPP